MNIISKLGLVIAAILMLASTPVLSCEVEFNDDDDIYYYAQTHAEKCYAHSDLSASIEQQRVDVYNSKTLKEKYQKAVVLMDQIVLALNDSSYGYTDADRKNYSEASNMLETASDMLANNQKYEYLGGIDAYEWVIERDSWNSMLESKIEEIGCGSALASDADCRNKYRQKLYPILSAHLHVHHDVITVLRKVYIAEEAKLQQQRAKQWDSYFSDTQFQYPWELWLNFAADGGFREDYIDKGDVVPTSRFIFLHPDAGFTIVDKEGANTVNPALNLQIFGIQGWNWDDDTNRAKHPLGISLSGLLTEIRGQAEYDLGITLIYSRYSLTLSEFENDVAFTINLNLMDWFGGDSNEAKFARSKLDLDLPE